MRDFVASSQAFIAKAGIVFEQRCPYIERHRAPLCVLLTHVQKPAFISRKDCLKYVIKRTFFCVVSFTREIYYCYLIKTNLLQQILLIDTGSYIKYSTILFNTCSLFLLEEVHKAENHSYSNQ